MGFNGARPEDLFTVAVLLKPQLLQLELWESFVHYIINILRDHSWPCILWSTLLLFFISL